MLLIENNNYCKNNNDSSIGPDLAGGPARKYWVAAEVVECVCDANLSALYFVGTQVEFPEARIYEETLNILLYEAQDGRGPDNALLEATGGAAGRSHHLDEDEERERERIERVRRIHIKRPDDRAHLHQ